MRTLGDLYEHGTDEEKSFVALFLIHTAKGGPIADQTWRTAQSQWEKAVRLQNDLGAQFPEVMAMYFLQAIISTDNHLDQP
jgi:hypothetical protein